MAAFSIFPSAGKELTTSMPESSGIELAGLGYREISLSDATGQIRTGVRCSQSTEDNHYPTAAYVSARELHPAHVLCDPEQFAFNESNHLRLLQPEAIRYTPTPNGAPVLDKSH